MDSFSLFFLLFISFTHKSSCTHICSPSSCAVAGPTIRFPFRLDGRHGRRCGYQGFDLYCNNRSQTILTLPFSGDFTVTSINYVRQTISVNDPGGCLPNRIRFLDLSASVFRGYSLRDYTFLNCSSPEMEAEGALRLPCLSGENYTVFAAHSEWVSRHPGHPSCRNFSRVRVPSSWNTVDLSEDLRLTWSLPACWLCEIQRRGCGFEGDTGLDIGCADPARRNAGLPRSAKYGIIVGVGIPALVCIMGLFCYAGGRIRTRGQRLRQTSDLSTTTITPYPAIVTMGLDGRIIESYPKTVLGQSRRLPKPNDSTCPICLSEYQPEETLRTIPECNHCFHVECIDEWLRLNATCPVCRNSPESSSGVKPCWSVASPSSSSST